MKKDELNALTPKLETAIQKAIEEIGLVDYQLDTIKLMPKSNMQAIRNRCVRRCKVIGIPPHVHIFCYFDCSGK